MRVADTPDPAPAVGPDPSEVAKFEAMAAGWWDPDGKFAPLHAMNPCRLSYVRDQIAAEFATAPDAPGQVGRPFEGLRLLDIGCGGGLIAEPLTRLGATVTGLDPSGETVGIAAAHARQMGLEIDYRQETAEALAEGGATFDVVLALEVIEHVPDPRAFLQTVARLVRPGGLALLSTLNRTRRAWALAVVGAERIFRWLPPGTHDWAKFVTPEELADAASGAGLVWLDAKGLVYDPLSGQWRRSAHDLAINYICSLRRPPEAGTP